MSDNNFNSTVESLFRGMDSFLTTKTVVGDAVKFDDGTIVLPLVEMSFGVGAGAFQAIPRTMPVVVWEVKSYQALFL